MNQGGTELSKPIPRPRARSVHWLFRSNIARRRTSFLPPDIQKRNFFGMSEILGVIASPGETVRSLTESKRLLDEARREISESRERAQIRTKHTFSRLPGFFPRKAETQAIERALKDEPSFTILYGASSVGKTALLREVLSQDKYHVLHFDLRIAGFADLASLYLSLSQQMEQYFEEIADKMEGFEEFEKEAWCFKHDRLNVQRRVAEASEGAPGRGVKTSDVARLMELFQSSLLKYWEFVPIDKNRSQSVDKYPRRQDSDSSDQTQLDSNPQSAPKSKFKWNFRNRSNKGKEKEVLPPRTSQIEVEKKPKKMPVIFFDEAHKLPTLIQSSDTMKCLLDSMLVLTKQDRLCHVIHATSDPFYQTWLRQLNVAQHCKIITIGDCSKSEMRIYYRDHVLPRVPDRLRAGLHFEELYDAFGGKLAHWYDYTAEYVNSNGAIDLKQSTHFLQAHALLNLHIIHSSQAANSQETNQANGQTSPAGNRSATNPDTLHPGLGPAGFQIYGSTPSPIGNQAALNPEDRSLAMVAGLYTADFQAMQLLKVLSRLTQPGATYLPYFLLCRELGVRAVDGMVRGKVLDLRWTDPVNNQLSVDEMRVQSGMSMSGGLGTNLGSLSGLGGHMGAASSATAVELMPPDDDIIPMTDLGPPPREPFENDEEEEVLDFVGPKLFPITPVMRFAMREVVQEYEDNRSVSEYASLSDVDEY
ncbi:hypothetical protein BDN72DRAFT_786875 [Pluteus cervinus]|uniref:Uncharacterized protein n=1 Tax=Pluteus cervinus TaxID=181527 RepID=A0ACD3BC11_9AGAR|nr:hypothetical protein BDN72DRAFT_786875 [Pluteus cervinus]